MVWNLCGFVGGKARLQQFVDGLYDPGGLVFLAIQAEDHRVGEVVGQRFLRVDDIVGIIAEHVPEIGGVL